HAEIPQPRRLHVEGNHGRFPPSVREGLRHLGGGAEGTSAVKGGGSGPAGVAEVVRLPAGGRPRNRRYRPGTRVDFVHWVSTPPKLSRASLPLGFANPRNGPAGVAEVVRLPAGVTSPEKATPIARGPEPILFIGDPPRRSSHEL